MGAEGIAFPDVRCVQDRITKNGNRDRRAGRYDVLTSIASRTARIPDRRDESAEEAAGGGLRRASGVQTPVMPLWYRPLATARGYGVKRHGTINQQLRRIRLSIYVLRPRRGRSQPGNAPANSRNRGPYGEFSTCTVTTSIP